jgi:hypothetical protein
VEAVKVVSAPTQIVVVEHVAFPPSHKRGCLFSNGAHHHHRRANDANKAIAKVRVLRSS